MYTFLLSALLALVFILFSVPMMYSATDRLGQRVGIRTSYDTCPGLPSPVGLLVHGCIFCISAWILLLLKPIPLGTPSTTPPLTKIDPPPPSEMNPIIFNQKPIQEL
jgi:hypothetical protein